MNALVYLLCLSLTFLNACSTQNKAMSAQLAERDTVAEASAAGDTIQPIVKSNAEWKKILPEMTYKVMRESGTERAFTGKYWDNHDKGIYQCAACKLPLFDSGTKFESGTGWPSFFDVLTKGNVRQIRDDSHGMVRTEVQCARCGGHLGHVFEDGPEPTGLRYCMNSAALDFVKK